MLDHKDAFSSFAVPDLDAARRFYGDTLGLAISENAMGFLAIDVAPGKQVMVYPKDDHEPAVFTILNFDVADIDAAVERLTGAGIAIERYDAFEHEDNGVVRDPNGPAIAWFKDPAGNVLSVVQS